jgi:hypothetical protein
MKPRHPELVISLIVSFLATQTIYAQPSLEFAGGQGPATSGSSIANQVVTWEGNTDNPTGNTFLPYTPTTKVTYSLSNLQYALTAAQSPNGSGVSFGGNLNTTGPMIGSAGIYQPMNFISNAPVGDFSSLPSTIGQGISLTANYGIELFTSTMGLFNAGVATRGRYYMADLTITFSNPATNPVLHLVGVGGIYSSRLGVLGFTTELDLSTIGVTLSKLSGSTELNVTASSILNSATHPSSTTGSGAASGSILVTGTNISKLVFHVYMRGDGNNPSWASATQHVGDAWILSVSEPGPNIALPAKITDFVATAQGNGTLLHWSTASEQNTDHFDVEYSTDGMTWQSIGSVKAAGNSTMPLQYSFVQYGPAAGNAFYRIAETDADGGYTYTHVQEVTFAQTGTGLHYYPNPVRDRVTVITGSTAPQKLTVMTIDGSVLQQFTSFQSGQSIDLSRYPGGVYILQLSDNAGAARTFKIQKN